MKRLFTLIILLSLVCFFKVNVLANVEEQDLETIQLPPDSLIVDMDYYPSVSISNKSLINLVWRTTKKMDELSIEVFSSKTGEYIKIFDMESLTDDSLNPYNATFKILEIPEDDPDTEIDESLEGLYAYSIRFPVEKAGTGIINIIFNYKAEEEVYKNNFYIPNVVNPSISIGNIGVSSLKTTKNSILVAIFSLIAGVCGTFIIISTSRKKRIEDEMENE